MKYRKIHPPEQISINESLIIEGDALYALRTLPEKAVRCAITS
ncbi:MAG: site-specific DNA-methyltransferase, partial [Gammaproteobacteria bacterium]|nr:site-specific DNA-methyltransferase [Gammaproteobacteria bacterium]